MGPLGTPRFFTPVPISVTFVASFLSLIIQMSDVSICQRRPSFSSPFGMSFRTSCDSRRKFKSYVQVVLETPVSAHPSSVLAISTTNARKRIQHCSLPVTRRRFRQAPIIAMKRLRRWDLSSLSIVQLESSKLGARCYLGPRYVRTTARTRDISIVPSSACRGNNSAGAARCDALYTGPLVVGPAAAKTGPGIDLLFILLPPVVCRRLLVFPARSGPGGSTRIQLPR